MTSAYFGPREEETLVQGHNGTTAQGSESCLSGDLGRCKQEITTPKTVLSLGPRSEIKKAMVAEQQSGHPERSMLALKRWDRMEPERHWYWEKPTCATLSSKRQLK